MRRLLLTLIVLLVPAVLIGWSLDRGDSGRVPAVQISLQTGEHPEHPAGSEHPEHPAAETTANEPPAVKKPVTVEDVATYLEGYAAEAAAEKRGWMEIRDEVTDRTLKLKLDRVHRERLSKTGEGTYFVCADFKDPEGKVYDLDFWVKETAEGLAVTETTIHKEAGAPRYNWVEKDGIWSRMPLSEK